MANNRMQGQTDEMRSAATQMRDAKPLVPTWTGGQLRPAMMLGVGDVSTTANAAVMQAGGFGNSVREGFDLFSQITALCANEYDESDTAGAEQIARTSAASVIQQDRVDYLNERDYYDSLQHYGRPEDFQGFRFEGDGLPWPPGAKEEGN